MENANNKMILDDVVETKVSDADIANVVARTSPSAGIDSKFVRPRKIRTIIRQFDKKVMPNDLCPCGAIDENGKRKKFKNCCKGLDKFDGRRELSAQEMTKCRYNNVPAWKFKEHLEIK